MMRALAAALLAFTLAACAQTSGSAPNAPASIAPSRPMLMSPVRSTSSSPSAAKASGVAVRTVAARNGSKMSIIGAPRMS